MWYLNFIIPFAVAFIGLLALTVFLVNLLCDAIVDGTTKKDSVKLGAEFVLEENVVGAKSASEVSPKALLELSAVEQNAPQCAGELA